jgi:hypothetical protein
MRVRIASFILICFLFGWISRAEEIRQGLKGSSVPLKSSQAEELVKIRDPFKRLGENTESSGSETISELEKFSVTELKLIGIITGGSNIKAMLSTPLGDTYTVGLNTLVGNKGGIVEKITNRGIRIREKFINIRGEKDFNITDLKIAPVVQAKSGTRREGKSESTGIANDLEQSNGSSNSGKNQTGS